jgi:hypothetical protein
VEKEILSLGNHPIDEENKLAGKNPLLPTKPLEMEPTNLDSVVKLVKELSNEVVDIKKSVGEGSSKKTSFHPFFKKMDNPPKPLDTPGRCVVCTRTEEEHALNFSFGGHGFFRYFLERESTHMFRESYP